MLLRKYQKRSTAGPCGLVEKGVACQRATERVQLTISGCLGPCDLPNVVTISNENGTQWLGEITQFGQYRDLVDWATRSRDAGELLPIPTEFHRHTLHPFRKVDSSCRR